MAKKNEVVKEVKRTLGAFKALKIANSENNLQKMVERYQLKNKEADYSEDTRARRAEKALAAIMDREMAMKKQGLTPLSNYQPLADIFHQDLAHLTDDVFISEAEVAIQRDLAKFGTRKVDEKVENEIITFHTNTAKKAMESINGIRILLTQKGLLKGKDAANIAALQKAIALHENAGNNAKAPAKIAASA